MFMNQWQRWISRSAGRSSKSSRAIKAPVKRRLVCESLEDRITPASLLYVSNNFVSLGGNQVTDPSVASTGFTATLGTNAFTTIGAAIAAASPGATVNVFQGSVAYNEDLVIPQALTLQSYSGQTATITAPASPNNLIVVEADNVTIANLAIDGANLATYGISNTADTTGSGGPYFTANNLLIRGDRIQNLQDGISISTYAMSQAPAPQTPNLPPPNFTTLSGVVIENNTLLNNGFYGILETGTISGTIFDNNINSPTYASAIVIGGDQGAAVQHVDFNTIAVGVGGNGIAVVNNNSPGYSFNDSQNTITGANVAASNDGTYTTGPAPDPLASLANTADYTWGIDFQNNLTGIYTFHGDSIGLGGSAAGANFAQGIHVWNSGTSSVALDSESIGHSFTGIAVVGVDPNFADISPNTRITINSAVIQAVGIGIKVQDSPSNVFAYPANGGPGSSTLISPTSGYVYAIIENAGEGGNIITNTPVGVLVDATGTATANASLTGTSSLGGDQIVSTIAAIQVNGINAILDTTSLGQIGLQPIAGKYVVLSNGAYNGLSVNGTGVTYGSVVGSTATVLQAFVIQNQITDALESSGVGFVDFKFGQLYVTPTTGSIQRAINVAPNGYTINVQAGNYTTSLTLPTESLTLSGSGVPGLVKISGAITGTDNGTHTINLNDLTFNGATLTNFSTVTLSSTSSTQGLWTDTALAGGAITFSRTVDQPTGSVSISGAMNVVLNGSSFAGSAAKGGNIFNLTPAFTGGPAITAFGGSGSFNTLYLGLTARNPVLTGAVPASSIPAGGSNQASIAYSGFASIPAKGTSLALDGTSLLPIGVNPVPPGFQPVTASTTYSSGIPYGWSGGPLNEFYRIVSTYGTAPSPIFQGGAYNSGGFAGTRTFSIAVAGAAAVPLTLYAGDIYGTLHPEIFSIYVNNTAEIGPATFTVNTGSGPNFQTLTTMVAPVGGVITVTLTAQAASYWVLNGIQVG